MQVYKFGTIFLNTQSRQVIKNGKPVVLTPKTFDVLQFMVENHGKIVSKDELMSRVWNGNVVEESNLAVHISKLRNLLAASKADPLIETVPGIGYRFVAIVYFAEPHEWQKNSDNSTANFQPAPDFTDSIAVLPLENEDNDEEIEYLADGLTESLINSLASIPNLKVIARNSVFRYKNKVVDTFEIGKKLGVSKILTGRIKIIRNNLKISVELINAADDTHLWGFHFNQPFSDIIKIQEEITVKVSSKLQTEISRLVNNFVSSPVTANTESFRLYLKGKYFLTKPTKDSVYQAIECFKESVVLDPLNIYSYVEIIDSFRILYVYDYLSYDEVLKAIKPHLTVISQFNQSVAEVQVVRGAILETLEWKFEEAEKHYLQALALNPNYLTAHYRYANLLTDLGKFPEALEEINKIIAIDPLSTSSYRRLGRMFYKMGRYTNAIKYVKESLELEPEDYMALVLLGGVYIELENYHKALDALLKSLKIQYNPETLSMIGYIYVKLGKTTEAREIIDQLEDQSKNERYISIKLARIYLALGDKEKTFELLEKAFLEHDCDLTSIKRDPRMKAVYNEPQFKNLTARIGLEED